MTRVARRVRVHDHGLRPVLVMTARSGHGGDHRIDQPRGEGEAGVRVARLRKLAGELVAKDVVHLRKERELRVGSGAREEARVIGADLRIVVSLHHGRRISQSAKKRHWVEVDLASQERAHIAVEERFERGAHVTNGSASVNRREQAIELGHAGGVECAA